MDESPDRSQPSEVAPSPFVAAGGTPVAESVPPPPSAWVGGPEPPSRGGLKRWLIIGGGVVVAIAAAIGIAMAVSRGDNEPQPTAVASPLPSPTILAPVEVSPDASAFAVTLSWTQPDGGTEVDRYSLYRNGDFLGSVNSPSTLFTDDEVVPGKKYTYEVEALGGGLVSDRASVEVRTRVPPLKEARVQGTFNVVLKTESQYGFQASLGKFTLGWKFNPKCDEGACNVTVKILNFSQLKGTLKRKGTFYDGSDTGKFNARCGGTVTSSTLSFDLTVKKAKAISDEWRASKLVGTLKQADAAQLGCVAAGATYSVTATLV